MPSTLRSVAAWMLVSLAGLGLVRGVVLLPERCASADTEVLDRSAALAVGWFERNQLPDGRWLYRYDARTNADLGGYNWVRHAGVLFSLEQAATVGYPEAAGLADRGYGPALEKLVPVRDGRSLSNDGAPSPGGSALLLVALSERRERTGDTDHDDLMLDLGAGILQQVQADGSVTDAVDASGAPIADRPTIFTTGEVAFALARLEIAFPDRGFGEASRRVLAYIATERAAREGYVPDNPEHWGAYALATVIRWPHHDLARLTPDELAWARKQLGIQSAQIRFESQRSNGALWWLRGHQGSGAATGTMGEALASLDRVVAHEPALRSSAGWSKERLECIAGLLADRQITPAEASAYPNPGATQGSWLSSGVTQMDNQQHALSAVLAARAQLSSDGGQVPRRTPLASSAWLVVLAAVAGLNPARVAASSSASRRQLSMGLIVTLAVLGGITLAGGPLLRTLDVSVPTAIVAAGLVLTVAGLVGLAWPRGREPRSVSAAGLVPVAVPLGIRPELIVTAAAFGAGGRGWVWFVSLGLAALTSVAAGPSLRSPALAPLATWTVRVLAAVATAVGVFLIVDGVYAV